MGCSRPQPRTGHCSAQSRSTDASPTPLAQKAPFPVTLPFPRFLISETAVQTSTFRSRGVLALLPKGHLMDEEQKNLKGGRVWGSRASKEKEAIQCTLCNFSFLPTPPFSFPFFLSPPLPLPSLPVHFPLQSVASGDPCPQHVGTRD